MPSGGQQPCHSRYFLGLAERCYRAARECLELHAKEEFRLLGDEFTQKARELDQYRSTRDHHFNVTALRDPPYLGAMGGSW